VDETPNERLIKAKESWAKTRRGLSGREVDGEEAEHERLPPGQHVVNTWPVLDLGRKPEIPQEDWRLAIDGFVARPLTWTWKHYLAEATFRSVSDFHCVTTWSTFDNEWQGVSFKRLIELVRPLSLATHVLFTSYDDYTTNLPMEACDDDDVLLAHMWNGKPLTTEHGGPVRMIVPKRYAWKGAKWVKQITFSDRDQKGFWEVRGYSNSALPWENDRYG
jgi:DMSO/TMAO reductase YedYZ molybdopterin-dependent catalytic subunit